MTVAMLPGSCARHQNTVRLIYVPAQRPGLSGQSQNSAQSVVIEEPLPPPPPVPTIEVSPLPEPEPPKPVVRPKRAVRTESSSTEPDTIETQPPEVPPLEPRASSEVQKMLHDQITSLQGDTERRIARLEQSNVGSAGDRQTLEDARHFLEESQRALTGGDLQRSQNLAHKASLLVDAVERNH